ncbi:hypothetical protein C5L22_16090 [Pantoea ananatis]|nr:hypothetical protein C5L22_16090 [Pantoea ananatis]
MRTPQKRRWARRLRIHQDDARQEFALDKLSWKSREHKRSRIAANEPGALFIQCSLFLCLCQQVICLPPIFDCSLEVAHDA